VESASDRDRHSHNTTTGIEQQADQQKIQEKDSVAIVVSGSDGEIPDEDQTIHLLTLTPYVNVIDDQ